ncbi:hypothetical protein RD792_007791 [Penstemon davidsonii]|uniref:thymidine kinase n=1 Tax=Penstemon davidsonii TaxID=160366 RepID=A0ABR0D7D7_9LAMI|nr:hypothetical protein RD792_007791 [Penstemon davidsonii]
MHQLWFRNVVIIKSNKDTRYGLDSIVTHDGVKLPCLPLANLLSFKENIGAEAYDNVRRSFGSVLDIIPIADTVTKLTARCEVCGEHALFTLRKTDETKAELIAGAEVYMPVCRKHYISGQMVKDATKAVLESQNMECSSGENKILEKTNRQKVVEVEKLSQTIMELEEAILAGGAATNTIRDYKRQISELNKLKDKLAISEKTTRAEAQVKMLMKKIETLTRAIEVELKKTRREAAIREKDSTTSLKVDDKIRNKNSSKRCSKAVPITCDMPIRANSSFQVVEAALEGVENVVDVEDGRGVGGGGGDGDGAGGGAVALEAV